MISGELIAGVVVLCGATFMVFAQVARARAVTRRGASVRVSSGFAQVAPYFFWVPYVVVVLRPGPELGRLIDALVERVIAEPALNERPRLVELARELLATEPGATRR